MARKMDARSNEASTWEKVSKEENWTHLSKPLFTLLLGG